MLDLTFKETNPWTMHLDLKGRLDEAAKFPAIDKWKNLKIIEVDFNDLNFLNSVGIAGWIFFLKEIKKGFPEALFVYDRCPDVIVERVNWIKGFLPEGGSVRSFYIPLYCKHCDHTTPLLVQANSFEPKIWKSYITPNSLTCDNADACRNDIDLDVIGTEFFKFLKRP